MCVCGSKLLTLKEEEEENTCPMVQRPQEVGAAFPLYPTAALRLDSLYQESMRLHPLQSLFLVLSLRRSLQACLPVPFLFLALVVAVEGGSPLAPQRF